MKLNKLAVIEGGQDGAIFNDYLFRFDHKGVCHVYNMADIKASCGGKCAPSDTFVLDKAEVIAPHSNCVMFGNEFYTPGDKYPLLYTNVYNNYAQSENKHPGMTMVYRIFEKDGKFSSSLVQIIEVDFTATDLWSSQSLEDKRPYGNFALDTKKGIYYAFTMHDESSTTKYFAFDLPKVTDGTMDEFHGVKKVSLSKEAIKEKFEDEYHHFMQGAVLHNEKIYSLEGFTDSEANPPAMRIIDVISKKQIRYISFVSSGYSVEPELIDFWDDVCYYADFEGNLYTIEF